MERLAGGATVGEIAAAWGRSERSVYRALTDVKRRLGARTDMHAIALWLGSHGRRNGTTPTVGVKVTT
jgi:DNA-binding CsgD family transcriptional regulator